MNSEEEYVNEIVNLNEKKNNIFHSKKYKNSLDYEKFQTEDYINYKLKEKIYNYLIPLNLSQKIKDEIFFLTKKFKKSIRENQLIPLAAYVIIKNNNINISQNELFKKLKLKKAYYLKYGKYLKNNSLDIKEIDTKRKIYQNKNGNIIESNHDKNKKEFNEINLDSKNFIKYDAPCFKKLGDNFEKEKYLNDILENCEHKNNKDDIELYDPIHSIKAIKKEIIKNNNNTFLNTNDTIIKENNTKNELNCVKFTDEKNEVFKPLTQDKENKNEKFLFDFAKNFHGDEPLSNSKFFTLEENFFNQNQNDKNENLKRKKVLLQNKDQSCPSQYQSNVTNNKKDFNEIPEEEKSKDQFSYRKSSENLKNDLINTFTNYVFRLKEFIKSNEGLIKSYFDSDIGENSKMNKDFSYSKFSVDDKIDYIFKHFFDDRIKSNNIHKNFHISRFKNHSENSNDIKSINTIDTQLYDVKTSKKSLNYIKKIEDVLNLGKNILNQNIGFFSNLNINNDIITLSLLRYVLEHSAIKIKLQIFKDLFDISISSISKTCKIFRKKNLLNN